MSKYQVGDLVRVSGHARYLPRRHAHWARHHIKSGMVCTVVGPETVETPVGLRQIVHPDQWKPAKQAMKKRAAYASRRGAGDPFVIPPSVLTADYAQLEVRAAAHWAHP